MSPTELYTFLRQAGFSHSEAVSFINEERMPNLNTDIKKSAIAQLQGGTNEKPMRENRRS